MLQAGGFTNLQDYVDTGVFTLVQYLDNFSVMEVSGGVFGRRIPNDFSNVRERLGISNSESITYDVQIRGLYSFHNALSSPPSSSLSTWETRHIRWWRIKY